MAVSGLATNANFPALPSSAKAAQEFPMTGLLVLLLSVC
jgi:hypothetical protein